MPSFQARSPALPASAQADQYALRPLRQRSVRCQRPAGDPFRREGGGREVRFTHLSQCMRVFHERKMSVLGARRRLELADTNEISIVMLNADCGYTLDEIAAAVRAKGWAAVIHSTHSNITTWTRADPYQQGQDPAVHRRR